MTIVRSFTSMPDVPLNSKLTPWQAEFMRATKTNIDLMTGANGVTHTALIRGDVQVKEVTSTEFNGDFDATDHYNLSVHVIALTKAVNALISQLN